MPLSPGPITAVLFDFSLTLFDLGEPHAWLDLAWELSGGGGSALEGLGAERHERLVRGLAHIWDPLREVDPHAQRDLSLERYRAVFETLLGRLPDVQGNLGQALFDALPRVWTAYEDALPTLKELKRCGLRLALVSNIALDIRPLLLRSHLLDLFDAVILSCEVGALKPQAAIFQCALDALGVVPGEALMVGDDPFIDMGAVLLGIRTLLLPATTGRTHGLGIVLKLMDAPSK